MILPSLQLDDETAFHYQTEADEIKQPLYIVLADRLRRAVALDPRHRYVILTDNPLARVEHALGDLPLQSAEELVARVQRLAKIQFGEHELELTPGQMEEIAWRASKQGKTVDAVLQETWRVFCENFFTLVVPGAK